jgi:hypothetical protein
LGLLTRWPIKTTLELPDRHHPRRRRGRETQFQSEPRTKYTGSLRSVLKQLNETLVNRARVQALRALRSESMALRSAHELPTQ